MVTSMLSLFRLEELDMEYVKDTKGKVYCIVDKKEFYDNHSDFYRPITYDEYEEVKNKTIKEK